MFRIFKVLKEIRLYREFVRIVRKEQASSEFWRRKNLRIDNLNRIYTVINIPAQLLASTDLPKEVRPSYVITEVKPINEYLKALNLHELLTMWIKPIDGTEEESFLVVYHFLFRQITWFWILRFLLEIVIILALIYKWDYIIQIF